MTQSLLADMTTEFSPVKFLIICQCPVANPNETESFADLRFGRRTVQHSHSCFNYFENMKTTYARYQYIQIHGFDDSILVLIKCHLDRPEPKRPVFETTGAVHGQFN